MKHTKSKTDDPMNELMNDNVLCNLFISEVFKPVKWSII